jgi:undecaprenyl-diphosphatase
VSARALGLWERVVAMDQALLLTVRRWERSSVTRLMRALTALGDPASWIFFGLVLGLSEGEGPRRCGLLGASTALSLLGSQVLKRLCRRPRPTSGIGGFAALAENPDAFSFPSGHTSVAFAAALALAGEGVGLGWLLLALAVGIGLSRIYLGAHYPLDVAAGALLGLAAGVAVQLLPFASSVL